MLFVYKLKRNLAISKRDLIRHDSKASNSIGFTADIHHVTVKHNFEFLRVLTISKFRYDVLSVF